MPKRFGGGWTKISGGRSHQCHIAVGFIRLDNFQKSLHLIKRCDIFSLFSASIAIPWYYLISPQRDEIKYLQNRCIWYCPSGPSFRCHFRFCLPLSELSSSKGLTRAILNEVEKNFFTNVLLFTYMGIYFRGYSTIGLFGRCTFYSRLVCLHLTMFQKEFKSAYKDAKLKPCRVHVLLHHAIPRAITIPASAKNPLVIVDTLWKQYNQLAICLVSAVGSALSWTLWRL